MNATTLKQFTQWYLEFGMRTMKSVLVPELLPIEKFNLPAYSTLHYLQALAGGMDDTDSEDNGLVLGPLADDPLLRNHSSVTFLVEPITKYINKPVGDSRVVVSTVSEQLVKYYNTAPNLKRLSKNESLITDKNICIYSYTALDSVYAYTATDKSAWYSFCNWYDTVLSQLKAAMMAQPKRHHFLLLEPPITMSSLSTLRDVGRYLDLEKPYSERVPQKYFKLFRTTQDKIFLDLWFFMGSHRQASLFNEIMGNDVDLTHLNILWQVGSRWCVVNLGRLNSFIMTGRKEDKGTITPERMESNFLVHVMRLGANFNVVDNDAPEDDPELSAEEKIANLDDPVRVLDIETSKVAVPNINIDLERPEKKKPLLSQSAALAKLNAELKAIDKDKTVEETIDEDAEEVIDAAIKRDLDQLEAMSAQRVIESTYEERYQSYEPTKLNCLDGVNKHIDAMQKKGKLSAKEVARLKRNAMSFQEAKNPWGGNQTIAEFMEVTSESIQVPEQVKLAEKIDGVVDEGMLNSSITHITKDYVENILRKDVMNALMHLQNGPYVVSDVKVQRHVDIMNDYETMTAKILTTAGKEKSIKIQYPTIKADGTYLVGGVKQRLRPQHSDLPIRKVSPTRVAMTSYISKIFVERTDRAAFNYSRWLTNNLRSRILDDQDGEIKNVVYGNAFDRTRNFPRAYSAVSMSLKSFDYQGYQFNFDFKQSTKVFTEQQLAFAKKHKVVPIGTNGSDGLYLSMDGLVVKSQGDALFTYGSFEKLFKLDEEKSPVDYVEYNLLGDTVPLGVILGYHLGLGNLLATLGAKPRRVSRGASYDLQPHEFIIKFQDEALIFDRSDRVTALLMSGFNRYKRDISRMSVYQFDTQDAYSVLLANNKINPRKLVDVDATMMYWVDHITAELLEKRGYPTNLVGLMIKATEMLCYDKHSDPNAASEQRERGQERIAGAIYAELYNSARSHMGNTLIMSGGFDLNPNAVWFKILNDTANMSVEESNPIHFLKEQEEVTLGGDGGRSGRTLMGKDRKFSPESMGVISEATVDSGEVAAKIFTTADPNYSTLRGEIRQLPKGADLNTKATRLQSTSMLLSVGADRDDPKRRNFINIQNSSSTFAADYTPMPLRSGYERVMSRRTGVTGDLWSKIATGDGEVVSIKNGVITVKYADGNTDVVELGTRHGTWAGKIVPHEVITDLKVGDKIKEGIPVAYNKHYYQKDSLYPDQVIFMNSTLARIVIWESDATFEDSSALTESLARRLATKFSKKRVVNVAFDHEVRDLVKVGDRVKADDLLCVLYPPLSTDAAERHDDVAREILERLSNESPRAKKKGVISKIEVRYSGEVEEMSETLRELVEHYDGEVARMRKQLKQPIVDGSISPNIRIDGKEIGNDSVNIIIHIDYDLAMSGGDKVVWGHQLKSVPCEVISGRLETRGGVKLDGIFGALSIEDRMVRSCYIMGTTNRLLDKTGEDACAIFFRNALKK